MILFLSENMSIFNLHTPARCNPTADEDNYESFASACTDPVLRRLFLIMVNKFQVSFAPALLQIFRFMILFPLSFFR